MDQMNVFHLTSVHSPSDTRIFLKECRSLARAKYEVSLVAPYEQDELMECIQIIAIPKSRNRFLRMWNTPWQVCRKAVAGKVDICHFHDPELIPVGILLRLCGKKVIYDVHEDLPRDILSKTWIPKVLRYPVSWFASFVEWISARLFFSAIVAATPTIAKRFPGQKTLTVQNYPIHDEWVTDNAAPYSVRPKNVLYIGAIARIRGIVENISAFDYVTNKDVRFILAGSFNDSQLESECKELNGWKVVEFRGWLEREELNQVLMTSRIGLVLLHPAIFYIDAYPVKLFEYMSAGLPVIASDFPLWREIVTGAECGLLVDPMDLRKIALAIDWLLDHPEEAEQMGANGRRAVLERYNWSNEEKKLLELYAQLA